MNYLSNLAKFEIADSNGKVNPKNENKCFDTNKGGKVTIYVEQSIAGSREITANIGHTFVGIEQNNYS